MVASPVMPVTGEAMPENVERFSKTVTYTKPHGTLAPLPKDGASHYQQLMGFVVHADHVYGVAYWTYSVEGFAQSYGQASYPAAHILARPEHMVGKELDTYRDKELQPAANSIWTRHEWYRNNLARWAELVPVPSEKHAGYVAYYQTPEKRARDIRTPIKPGRFLSKYFGDILTQEQIQQHAAEWEAANTSTGAVITQDADEIEAVYRSNYLGSCMHFGDGGWAGPCHPARVYAGPDLGIAYLGSRTYAAARVLVWPEKKIFYTKGYGDKERLFACLRELGYTMSDDSGFTGGRLRRILAGHRGFVLPYIDTHSNVRDDGEYLILDTWGSIDARPDGGGDGVSEGYEDEDEDRTLCWDCEEYEHDDNITYIRGHAICDSCRSDNYFYCELTHDYHHDDDRAETVNGAPVSVRGVENSSRWFYCEKTDQWYPAREYSKVELIEGENCEHGYAAENGFYCEYSEQYSFDFTKRILLSNDTSVHLDSFDNEAELTCYLNNVDAEIISRPRDPNTPELELEAA